MIVRCDTEPYKCNNIHLSYLSNPLLFLTIQNYAVLLQHNAVPVLLNQLIVVITCRLSIYVCILLFCHKNYMYTQFSSDIFILLVADKCIPCDSWKKLISVAWTC